MIQEITVTVTISYHGNICSHTCPFLVDYGCVLFSEDCSETLDELRSEVENILDGVIVEGACKTSKIRGVSLSWANDIMGAVITALIPVDSANSPMTVNTPHLPSKDYNPTGDGPTLPRTCVNILERLIDEAEKFFNGEYEKPGELFSEAS